MKRDVPKTILVTRPVEQPFLTQLSARWKVEVIPVIETRPIPCAAPARALLHELREGAFSHLIFTSETGVRWSAALLEAEGIALPHRLVIAAQGTTTAEAVRTCKLARELLDGHKLVKLEVLGDQKTLFPNVTETLIAAEELVKDGFDVMVYTSDDPLVAKRLEEIGCCAVMPLGAPIGSGLGIRNPYNLMMILENARVPIIVDAGVGTASDAAIAMELGCDGVLMNSAIAHAQNPVLMASAMKKAVEAGREAYLAGRMPRKLYASASSPLDGLIHR